MFGLSQGSSVMMYTYIYCMLQKKIVPFRARNKDCCPGCPPDQVIFKSCLQDFLIFFRILGHKNMQKQYLFFKIN